MLPEMSELQSLKEGIICFFLLTLVIGWFMFSAGVITLDKPEPEQPAPINLTPIPERVTAAQTPTPIPTPDYTGCGWEDKCFHIREWYSWFRENVSGYQDLSTHATIYGYKLLPNYHYQDPLWGTRSYFKISPEPGYKFLFVFVNVYSDGDDVRQYGIQPHKFMLQIKDKLYYKEDLEFPENWIVELQNEWDYAHVSSPSPYGYLMKQEAGTGIKSAIPKEYLMGGRSNAWDGFIIFSVPGDTNLNEVKIAASFDNLGGNAWWKLV